MGHTVVSFQRRRCSDARIRPLKPQSLGFLGCLSVMMMMIVVIMPSVLVLAARRGHSHRSFPKFLRWSRELFHVGKEDRYLPDVLVAENLVPRRHAGVADAVANDEVVV